MTSAAAVRLGHLFLQLSDSGITSFLTVDWVQLDTTHLDPSFFSGTEQPILDALGGLLRDPGVGFGATCIRQERRLLLRVSLVPSDVNGSTWKRWEVRPTERENNLRSVLRNLRKGWNGEGGKLIELDLEEKVGMPDLYASIPSPLDPILGERVSVGDHDAFARLEGFVDPRGLRTTLYRYQFRSVGKMAQMETRPGVLVDPLFTRYQEAGREGEFYVNLQTMDVQRRPGWYHLPKGGILCEQMGTGKTLMCLSLILSTSHQPCRPPPHSVECSQVVTDHAEASYPFEGYDRLRQRIGCPRFGTKLERPSLVELCANILALTDPSAAKSADLPPTAPDIAARRTLYYHIPLEDDCTRRAKAKPRHREIRRVYLANTTLVVVPGILVTQWRQEIEMHVEEGALKVLTIAPGPLPSVEEMIAYDVVLMDKDRFSVEENEMPSELEGARWKRLILDEGHVAGNQNSNAMRLAKKLSVERRWLVSGTPTTHLQQGGEAHTPMAFAVDGLRPRTQLHPGRAGWTKRDGDDARRIGTMICGFLEGEPFRTDVAFTKIVIQPLEKGRPGAVERMKGLMSSLMIKHAPGVIDGEASLPPMTITTELVDFHPIQRITYNVLAALICSNVYTSGFEDQDYFLHPKNTDAFNDVIRNLHLACFWFSAREMGAQGAIKRTRAFLEDDNLPERSRSQLEQAVRYMEEALSTPGWLEWMDNGVSVPFEVGGAFPYIVRTAWSNSMDEESTVIDANALHQLRDLNKRGTELHHLHIAGWDRRATTVGLFVEVMTSEERKLLFEGGKMARAAHSQKMKRRAKGKDAQSNKQSASQHPVAVRPRTTLKRTSVSKAAAESVEGRLDEATRNARLLTAAKKEESKPRPLPDAIRTVSRSSKVNFVLETVLSAAKEDKFVIFGTNDVLGHLTEALDLAEIPSCFVGHRVASAGRRDALREFEQPQMRVCLLDIKLAARGLNLVVANRMIFLAPVWNPDVQAQAIKTQPTSVQILVAKGTFEEDIAGRSANARTENEEKLYSRAMIENPRFVEAESLPTWTFEASLIPRVDKAKAESLALLNATAGPNDAANPQAATPAHLIDEDDLDELETSSTPDTVILTPATSRASDWSRTSTMVSPSDVRTRGVRFAAALQQPGEMDEVAGEEIKVEDEGVEMDELAEDVKPIISRLDRYPERIDGPVMEGQPKRKGPEIDRSTKRLKVAFAD